VYALKATVTFVSIMAVALKYRRGRHPFERYGPANWVTTVRALLVALVVGLVGETPTSAIAIAAIVISLAATLLDGVDGWLARRSGLASEFGARFDLEIDALLILALAILVWRHEKAGGWILLSGLLRYLFVAAGWVFPWMRGPLPQTRRAKAVCVLQIATLVLALSPPVPESASAAIAGAGLLALGSSFLVDTLWLRRHAAETGQ
jgi:phosphatidylglycerophosphate synthase